MTDPATAATGGSHGVDATYKRGCRCDACRAAHAAYRRRQRRGETAPKPRRGRIWTPLTPDQAWEALGLDKTPFEDSPLDYADADQKSKSVFFNDERWAVLVIRKGRD